MSAVFNVFRPFLHPVQVSLERLRFKVHNEIRAGSIIPLYRAIAFFMIPMYTFEYLAVGQYHVADKKKIVREAMKAHSH